MMFQTFIIALNSFMEYVCKQIRDPRNANIKACSQVHAK